MLPMYFYIFLGIYSSWLIWFGFMLYYISILDTSFRFVPLTKYDRYKYLLYICVIILFSYYLFFVRLRRIGLSFNLLDFYDQVVHTIALFDIEDLIIIGLFILVVLIFWYLLMRLIYQYFRKCIIALYLYYYQYRVIADNCDKFGLIGNHYHDYLWNRVSVFYETQEVFDVVRGIWPIIPNIIEKNMYRFLIPYLIVFDIIVQDYCITKIFLVIPWVYVYTIIRSAVILLEALCSTIENRITTWQVYGGRKDWFS